MILTGKVSEQRILPYNTGSGNLPQLQPFDNIFLPTNYNPYGYIPPAAPGNVNQPMLDAPSYRPSSNFDPFGNQGMPPVPHSKMPITRQPLIFKKDPNPSVPGDEVIDLRDAYASEGGADGSNWLTWALVLGGLGAMYYYSKKKGKK